MSEAKTTRISGKVDNTEVTSRAKLGPRRSRPASPPALPNGKTAISGVWSGVIVSRGQNRHAPMLATATRRMMSPRAGASRRYWRNAAPSQSRRAGGRVGRLDLIDVDGAGDVLERFLADVAQWQAELAEDSLAHRG